MCRLLIFLAQAMGNNASAAADATGLTANSRIGTADVQAMWDKYDTSACARERSGETKREIAQERETSAVIRALTRSVASALSADKDGYLENEEAHKFLQDFAQYVGRAQTRRDLPSFRFLSLFFFFFFFFFFFSSSIFCFS